MAHQNSYKRPLPDLLGGLRARRIRRALTSNAPSDQAIRWNGFNLLFDEGLPTPAACHGFCPTSFLARNLQVRAGERILDLATGPGLVALEAARRGARVTAIDWQQEALATLRRNALMAGMDEPELRNEDGLEGVAGERFDVVTWAAPFLKGVPRGPRERRLLRGPDRDFLETLRAARDVLNRGGRLLLPFPDRDGSSWLHSQLEAAEFRFRPIVLGAFPLVGKVRLYQCWAPTDGAANGLVAAGEALSGTAWLLRDR